MLQRILNWLRSWDKWIYVPPEPEPPMTDLTADKARAIRARLDAAADQSCEQYLTLALLAIRQAANQDECRVSLDWRSMTDAEGRALVRRLTAMGYRADFGYDVRSFDRSLDVYWRDE